MKFRHVLTVLTGLALLSFGLSYTNDKNDKPAPRSPKIVTPYTPGNGMPGSGHAFGYGVAYKVAVHKMHKGETYAVVTSAEPDVEIWTPISQVVAMMDGTKFHVIKASKIDDAIQRISSRNK